MNRAYLDPTLSSTGLVATVSYDRTLKHRLGHVQARSTFEKLGALPLSSPRTAILELVRKPPLKVPINH